jgi:hypothetical protein
MQAQTGNLDARQIGVLLRGEPERIDPWIRQPGAGHLVLHLAWIIVGAGIYGAAVGMWRGGEQALYTAIKLPLIILLTALANALLNGMLAPLLGLNITLRQSFFAILTSFSISAAILGAFSPLVAFIIWNTPPLVIGLQISGVTYGSILLAHVIVIAFAGTVANLRLSQWLRQLGGTPAAARRVLCAWLAGNLFLGSQLSWILRPFVGSPGLPVEFLRPNALHGSFYETIFRTFVDLFLFLFPLHK